MSPIVEIDQIFRESTYIAKSFLGLVGQIEHLVSSPEDIAEFNTSKARIIFLMDDLRSVLEKSSKYIYDRIEDNITHVQERMMEFFIFSVFKDFLVDLARQVEMNDVDMALVENKLYIMRIISRRWANLENYTVEEARKDLKTMSNDVIPINKKPIANMNTLEIDRGSELI